MSEGDEISRPTEKKGSKVPDHVPRFDHLCPRPGHGWEVCGIAASLLDPHDPTVEHGCSVDVDPVFTFQRAEVREVGA